MSEYKYIKITPVTAHLIEVADENSDYNKGVNREMALASSAPELHAQLNYLLYAFDLIRHRLPAEEDLTNDDRRALRIVEQVRHFSGELG